MKRILSLILCAVLLCGLLGTGALAEGTPKVLVTGPTEELKPGDTVKLYFTIENNPGLNGFSFGVDYDESVLTFQRIEKRILDDFGDPFGTWFVDNTSFPTNHKVMWIHDALNTYYNGTDLFMLQFVVADDAPTGTYDVTMSMSNSDSFVGENINLHVGEVEFGTCELNVKGTEPQTLDNGFYLIGINGWTVDKIDPAHKFTLDDAGKQEYKLVTELAVGNEIKVVKVENGAIAGWYPSEGGNYTVDAAHSGAVNIYFKETYQSDWANPFGGYFYIAARHTITVDENITNGTVAADKTSAAPQEDVTVTVTPAAGYELDELYYLVEDGTTQTAITETDGVYSFKMPNGNVTIYATFKLIKYTVTVSAQPTEGGTVSVEPAEAAPGTTIRVIVEAAPGYELTSLTRITGDSDHVEEIVKDDAGEYTFVMPEGNVAVTAAFTAIPLSITVDENITNGTVTAPETATVGETVTVTVTPAEDYELDELYYKIEGNDNKIPINADNGVYTFEMPSKGVTIYATFKAALTDGFYLAGVKGWDPADLIGYKFVENPENPGEYMLDTFLPEGTEIKAVKVENGAIAVWYPAQGDNYTVNAAHSGQVTVFFRDTYQSDWSEFGGYINIQASLDPSVVVYGSNLSLKGDIGLNFFLIPTEELLNDENAYVELTVAKEDGTTTVKLNLRGAKTRKVGDDTLYQYSVKLNAKQMFDVVTLKVFDGQNNQVSLISKSSGNPVPDTGYTYKVQDYIQMAPDYFNQTDLTALMTAMSDYGALAQQHFGYNLGNVAEVKADLGAVTADTLAEFALTSEGSVEGVSYYGVSLLLESETTLRIYFTPASGAATSDYTFKLGSSTLTPEEHDGKWYVDVPNISAKKLDNAVTVTVTKGEDTLTINACALSYCYKVLTDENITDQTLKDLVKGIYLYNQAANVYFKD